MEGFNAEYAEEIRDRLDDGESATKIAREEDVSVAVIERMRREKKNTYVIMGHGSDICDNGKLEVLDVPKGCVYVTLTQCGLVTFVGSEHKFFDDKNITYLQDPVKYEKELKKIFGNDLHVHHSEAKDKVSRTYVNNRYFLAATYKTRNNKCHMGVSGVVKLPKPELKNIKTDAVPCDNPPKILGYYEHSVYPKLSEVESAVRARPDINFGYHLKTITQEELFKKFPGIHYNILCRYTDKSCLKETKNRRAESVNIYKSDKEVESIIRYIQRLAYTANLHNDFKELHLAKLKPLLVNFTDADRVKLRNELLRAIPGNYKIADKFLPKQNGKGRTLRHTHSLNKTAKRY